MDKGQRFIGCLLAVIAVASTAGAEIINIPEDFPTIQEGIDAAMDGDVIVVAMGTYVETIDYLGKAISIRSSDPENLNVVAATVIDGDGSGPVVTLDNTVGASTGLAGFTITNGSTVEGGGLVVRDAVLGPSISNCVFSGNTATERGGGMFTKRCVLGPIVSDCKFVGNSALGSDGGGGLASDRSSVQVTHCSFASNSAPNGKGGGMFFLNEDPLSNSPLVSDCTFVQNTAGDTGGGLDNVQTESAVRNCEFTENTAGNAGGGLRNWSVTEVIACTFKGNAVTGKTGRGGGLRMFQGTVTDCVFFENIASFTGGGLDVLLETSLSGLTFCDNEPNDFVGPIVADRVGVCDPCPSDHDDNGQVGFEDLLDLLRHWGPCPE